VFNSYYYNIKCLTPSVHNEISIHITFIICVSYLQYSVNWSYNSLPSNKWVALTRAGWCVVSAVDYPEPASELFFTRYSGEVSEFIVFRCDISSRFCMPKTIKIVSFFAELFKILKGGRFLRHIVLRFIPEMTYYMSGVADFWRLGLLFCFLHSDASAKTRAANDSVLCENWLERNVVSVNVHVLEHVWLHCAQQHSDTGTRQMYRFDCHISAGVQHLDTPVCDLAWPRFSLSR